VASSSPDLPYAFDNQLFFRANTVATGRELWRSDGTAANTVLVKDINPDAGTGLCNGAYAALNNELYFAAGDSHIGCELWKTDGLSNTSLVANIAADNPDGGGVSSNPFNLITAPTPAGDRLFFTANTATAGSKLYITNGSSIAQVEAKLDAGVFDSFFAGDLTVFNNALYFDSPTLFQTGLGMTDGTIAGTVAVYPPTNQPTVSSVSHIFAAPNLGLLLFQGVTTTDGGSPVGGNELWASDGKQGAQGGHTYLVLDINPGGNSSFPQQFHAVGHLVVFAATTDATGTELWVTDGTAAGTRLVKDILPGPGNGITTFF
jgi:ELWxxDGT repeat protein